MSARIVALFTALFAVALGSVIEATDADIESYLSSGVPAIVDLWAPWCSHCKSFSPKFDELAALYDHLPDKIQFLKVDGEANRKTAQIFDLEYFPTIKFVAGKEQEEIHDRSIKNIQKVIKAKTGVSPEDAPSEVPLKRGDAEAATAAESKVSRDEVESHILELHDGNFEDGIDGKHALVAFTTTWCHFCKSLRPEWQKAAQLYAHDESIEFVNVDCTDKESAPALMETFHVEGFPTIVYFPADGSVPKPYGGPRTVDGFVDFFKRVGASSREVSGELSSDAGLIPGIDVSDLIKAEKQLQSLDSPYKQKYLHIIKKATADPQYIDRETTRIAHILDSHREGTALIQNEALDNFQIRLNILKSLALPDPEAKKEL